MSPRHEDEQQHATLHRRKSGRKKDSKSTPSSPAIQPTSRSASVSHTSHTPKKRTHSTNSSNAIHPKTQSLHHSLPDIPKDGYGSSASKPMDLDTLGNLVRTLIQQNNLLNQKVDHLTQELTTLKSAVHLGTFSSMEYRSSHSLSGHKNVPTNTNPLATSSPSNSVPTSPLRNSSNNPSPLSMSNHNVHQFSRSMPAMMIPSVQSGTISPTQFSPTYSTSQPPFSAHPLELRGTGYPSSNPFTGPSTSTTPLACFPH
eukprot:TRINITY_DN348_c0_g1_i2.p1 TRINITY_DN348_c0_g1~~TRINITY_DN348_c0_g1_i2.p1  ORF type:complete len:257 (-),score=20.03 TRINITY_DN348_c0_g1_i2:56-826(-)